MTNIFSVNEADYQNIDSRLKPFLIGWTAVQNYGGVLVEFPAPNNSKSNIYPYKYFEVIKKPEDYNFRDDERDNEIQLYLSIGWRDEVAKKYAFDDEAVIVLMITGRDVLSGENNIHAEIHNFAGSPVKIYFKGILVTDFTKTTTVSTFFGKKTVKTSVDKYWVEDMTRYLVEN